MKKKQKILFLSGLLLLSSLIIQFQTKAETYPTELADAYDWAYAKGIITTSNIDNANMYGEITNGELAKLMVIYAENVLNKTPDTSKVCNFTDIDEVKGDLHDYIIESCQLGMMGIGTTTFEPYDIANRATFGSALSRALRGEEYEGGTPYYSGHLNALKSEGIMIQIDNPEDMVEVKGYLLLMLMRTEEYITANGYQSYPTELANAYDWAYAKGIVTMSNIDNANMYGEVTNGELAKLMVIYAENVLNKTPDTSKVCNFTDIDEVKGDLHDYIIESCQLGMMGIGTTTFEPDYIANRATFGSALSRALRGEEYEGGTPYYSGHLNALKSEGIINQTNKPETTEVKGYVLLTLMRAEEYRNAGTSSPSSGNTSQSNGNTSGRSGNGGSSTSKTKETNTSTNTTKTNTSTEKQGDKTENKTTDKKQDNRTSKTTTTTKTTNYNKGNQSEIQTNGFTKEMNDAYQFAHKNGITTTKNIETAKINSPLTRIQMAKMLSNYAINVLGKEPDLSKGTIKFNDVTDKQNAQYDNAVTLAYQLGIMGQNTKKFRPNDIVTRAEFVTALSRMLYGTEDGKGSTKYYETHINKLYNEGIITKKDPKIHEKRGYVMIMLMRTAE